MIMATRKIRLTMSGTKIEDQGPIVDIDFNGENQDADVDVSAVYGESTIVKEYTVDVTAGTYNLDVTFKNDLNSRDLIIDKIEVANDGIAYEDFIVLPENCSLGEYLPMLIRIDNADFDPNQPDEGTNRPHVLNPSYDPTQPRTDTQAMSLYSADAGANPQYVYVKNSPLIIYTAQTVTFNITFS